mmetsp:Transcript_122364/g.346962  ORF Transcript_122364/g.346962 Transcript_122364/m.346962 type:complete len:254 (-) Transcript_122364:734-1495(-)
MVQRVQAAVLQRVPPLFNDPQGRQHRVARLGLGRLEQLHAGVVELQLALEQLHERDLEFRAHHVHRLHVPDGLENRLQLLGGRDDLPHLLITVVCEVGHRVRAYRLGLPLRIYKLLGLHSPQYLFPPQAALVDEHTQQELHVLAACSLVSSEQLVGSIQQGSKVSFCLAKRIEIGVELLLDVYARPFEIACVGRGAGVARVGRQVVRLAVLQVQEVQVEPLHLRQQRLEPGLGALVGRGWPPRPGRLALLLGA